jgi:hypothetical protein
MYEEIISDDGSLVIKHFDSNGQVWWIPANESNRMYQEYLIWKQENS